MFRQLLKSTFIFTVATIIVGFGTQTCLAQRSCEIGKVLSKAKGEFEVEGTYTLIAGDTIDNISIYVYKDNNFVKSAPADYSGGFFKGFVIGLDSMVTYQLRMIMFVTDNNGMWQSQSSKKVVKATTK